MSRWHLIALPVLLTLAMGAAETDQPGRSAAIRGPGPDLTRVGSTLSRAEIKTAVLDPSQPMPSFKRLPAGKLAAIVEFLSLLR
jgi:hypothetical protein